MTSDATVTLYFFAIVPSVSPRRTSCSTLVEAFWGGAGSRCSVPGSDFCFAEDSDFGFALVYPSAGGAAAGPEGATMTSSSPAATSVRAVTRHARRTAFRTR